MYDGKKLNNDELLTKLSKGNKNFLTNYFVYADLTKKGYIVKSGLKFGGAFRIYNKGDLINQAHSKWVCIISESKNKFSWHEFASKNRVAHSTKKKLLVAIVDEENKVSYYESSWLKLS